MLFSNPRAHRTGARGLCAVLGATALTLSLAGVAHAAPDPQVTTLRDLQPAALGRVLAGAGVTVRGTTFTGDPVQAGRFTDLGVSGLPTSGVALSSGSLVPADPQSDDDVDFTRSSLLGPNTSLTTTGDLGGPGDDALTALHGATTYDAATLSIVVVPRGDELSLTWALGSEEYATWTDQGFRDAVAVWVDDAPCSLVPGTEDLAGTDTINASVNADLYVANFAPDDPGAGAHATELNAFTTALDCEADVTPRRAVTVRVAVADTVDGQLDSTVLLARGSLTSTRTLPPLQDLLCLIFPWLPWCDGDSPFPFPSLRR